MDNEERILLRGALAFIALYKGKDDATEAFKRIAQRTLKRHDKYLESKKEG